MCNEIIDMKYCANGMVGFVFLVSWRIPFFGCPLSIEVGVELKLLITQFGHDYYRIISQNDSAISLARRRSTRQWAIVLHNSNFTLLFSYFFFTQLDSSCCAHSLVACCFHGLMPKYSQLKTTPKIQYMNSRMVCNAFVFIYFP